MMLCPNCSDQALKSVNTLSGRRHVCPSCRSIFAPWAILARLPAAPPQFLVAINSLLSFRLPTGRICPQCGKTMEQGRMPGSGVIVMVCSTCHSVFADLETLGRMDGNLASTLSAQMGMPAPSPATNAPAYPENPIAPPPANITPPDPAHFAKQADLEERYKLLENEIRYAGQKREEEMAKRLADEIKKAQEALEKELQTKASQNEADIAQRMEALKKINADLERQRAELATHLEDLKNRLQAAENQHASL